MNVSPKSKNIIILTFNEDFKILSNSNRYFKANESENIFAEILEYNDVTSKNGKKYPNSIVNSTSFRLFLTFYKILL